MDQLPFAGVRLLHTFQKRNSRRPSKNLMSVRRMETTLELPKFLSGMGGFPRLPEETRHYACNVGYTGWNCYKVDIYNSKAFCPTCKSVRVPAYLPEFLDKYVIEYKFKDGIPVVIGERSMLMGKNCLSNPTPSSPPPESPSVRQVPSAAYTGVHKPPKNPFQ